MYAFTHIIAYHYYMTMTRVGAAAEAHSLAHQRYWYMMQEHKFSRNNEV